MKLEDIQYTIPEEPIDEKNFDIEKWMYYSSNGRRDALCVSGTKGNIYWYELHADLYRQDYQNCKCITNTCI